MTKKRNNNCEFIAELCQNHLGKRSLLDKMVNECAENGADTIKIQNIFANNLTFRPRFENGLTIKNKTYSIKRPYKQEYNRLKNLELSIKDNEYFIRLCEKLNVTPMTTCFSREHVKSLHEIGYKKIKVASYDCASFQMLKELNKLFDKIYVSTGATYDQEINFAHKIIDNQKLSFLHCVTIYPTPKNQLHLSRINFLKKFTKNVGFSDHSKSDKNKNFASSAAIYYGASIIERHITILDKDQTKDGPVSIIPEDIAIIKKFSRLSKYDQRKYLINKYKCNFKLVCGSAKRNLSDLELLNRDYYRGRFASVNKNKFGPSHIFNWEEIEI